MELGTARVAAGLRGSMTEGYTGAVGLSANIVGAETTLAINGGHSLTVGGSIGVSGMVEVKVQDRDGDGNKEGCAKVSWGAATVGACVETEDISDRFENAKEAVVEAAQDVGNMFRGLWNRL